MTTDAPPEKMMLGDLPCPACGGTPYDVGHGAVTCQNNQCALREIRIMRSDWNRNRRVGISKHRDGWTGVKCSHCEGNGCAKCGNTGDEYDGTQDDREAARRLSAPAPAAPRVGDDAIGLANIAKFCWEDAEAEIRELTEALGVSRQMRDEDWRVIAKLRYDCAEWKRQALSAPPAASADEREECAALVEQTKFALSDLTEREKMLLTIAARAIRRGRHLTDHERFQNLDNFMTGSSDDVAPGGERHG